MVWINELTWWQLWEVGMAAEASGNAGSRGRLTTLTPWNTKVSAWHRSPEIFIHSLVSLQRTFMMLWSSTLDATAVVGCGWGGICMHTGPAHLLRTPQNFQLLELVFLWILAAWHVSPGKFSWESVEQSQWVSQHSGGCHCWGFQRWRWIEQRCLRNFYKTLGI